MLDCLYVNSTQTEPKPKIFSRQRFHAARELRGLSMQAMAQHCDVTVRHLWYVVTQERQGSAALLAKMRAQLGEPGWTFATGQTDTLRDDGGGHAG